MEGILFRSPEKVKNEISSENPRGSAPQSAENVEIRVEKSEKWIVTARPIEGCSDFDFLELSRPGEKRTDFGGVTFCERKTNRDRVCQSHSSSPFSLLPTPFIHLSFARRHVAPPLALSAMARRLRDGTPLVMHADCRKKNEDGGVRGRKDGRTDEKRERHRATAVRRRRLFT